MMCVFQFGRGRREQLRRALALWLIAAQVCLYVAAGFAHVHSDSHDEVAHWAPVQACPESRGENDAHLHAATELETPSPLHCRLCEAARSVIAAPAPAPRPAAVEPIPHRFARFDDFVLLKPVSRPGSARAPPTG
jgi:hypothetical protein